VNEGHIPPIVNNGIKSSRRPSSKSSRSTPKRRVDQLWRYKRELPEDLLQLHPTNRGVALWRTGCSSRPVDAHLIAPTPGRDGPLGHDRRRTTRGYYFTLAPLVARQVMIGTSGASSAFAATSPRSNAKDGKPVWKTHTIRGRASRVTTPGPERLEDGRRVGLAHRAL